MTSRGGPQRIPRPDDWELGADPPWIDRAPEPVTLAHLERALRRRGPGRIRADGPTRRDGRQSAVLIPLYEDDGDLRIILTRRSPRMRTHTHEVSFPGGAHDEDDDGLWETALREAEEEIGLDPALPRLIGELDRFVTVGSQSLIHPYVAALPDPPSLVASPDEVESILRVSVAELLSKEVWREELWRWQGDDRRAITFFELIGDTVWGATAAMLRQLLAIGTGVDDDLGSGRP